VIQGALEHKGSININQNASIYVSLLDEGTTVIYPIAPGRSSWVQVVKGTLEINNYFLNFCDGAAVESELQLKLTSKTASEILII
jgi:redox-sensitive bicupin YhaK (pirin superfamily)